MKYSLWWQKNGKLDEMLFESKPSIHKILNQKHPKKMLLFQGKISLDVKQKQPRAVLVFNPLSTPVAPPCHRPELA